MPTEIRIPEVSVTRDTTILLKWLKREGDEVREGEPIAEIESDKGAIEVEAQASGTLGEQVPAASAGEPTHLFPDTPGRSVPGWM